MATKFQIEGVEEMFDSMLAVAKHLGRTRIYRKDFERLGVSEKEVADKSDEPAEPTVEVTEEPTVEVVAEPETEPVEEPEAPLAPEEPKAEEEALVEKESPQEEEPEASTAPEKPVPAYVLELREKAGLKTIDDLYKKIRGAKYEDVISFAESLELGWERNDNPKVNRMNCAKALREALFHGEDRPHRPKSPWYGTPTEVLKQICDAAGIEWRDGGDDRVTRMWAVKELKAKGITEPPKL